MEFSQLRYFLEVARLGSFTKAAEKLCISQPALSKQILALEISFDLNLFKRHSRGVALTEGGRRLFEYAEQVLNLVSEAKASLTELQDLETGHLTIGASSTIGNYLLPAILASYIKLHPAVDLSLQVGNTNQIVELAANGTLDLAFVPNSVLPPGLCLEPLFEDEIILLTGSANQLAGTSLHSPDLLKDEILICRENGSATKQLVDSVLEKLGVKPRKVISFGNTEAVKRAVITGLGVTFLSYLTVSMELENKLLISPDISELKIKRPIICIYPKGARLSAASLSFLAYFKKNTADLSTKDFQAR